MTLLMAEILGVWVLALLAGVPLFATMGLAAFAFVAFGGLSMSIVPQKLAQSVESLGVALQNLEEQTLRRLDYHEKMHARAKAERRARKVPA